MSEFIDTFGFERADVGLHNWRERPYSAWAFQNVGEIVNSATVTAGNNTESRDRASPDGLESETVCPGTGRETIEEFLTRSHTESLVVTRSGQCVMDWHARHTMPALPHILFSISKSITGLLAGILEDQGLLDPSRTVAHYVPEAAPSGYGDCPLQYVLDMRVSLDFIEDYLDTTGGYARYRRATGWNPSEPGQPVEGLERFLFSLAKGDEPHGGDFRYLSPNSDLLGLVLERVTGKAFADLMSDLLWQPLGAATDGAITLDPFGAPRCAGGISVTTHDLARLGELILNEGAAGSRQIVSARWLNDMRDNGDADAWAEGDFATMMPGGRYRNKWYQLGPGARQIAGVGIHGQWLFIDPETQAVIAKNSSQALPLDEALDLQSIALFTQISAMV